MDGDTNYLPAALQEWVLRTFRALGSGVFLEGTLLSLG